MNTLQISDTFDPYYVGRKGLLTPSGVSDDQPARDRPAPADRPPAKPVPPAEAADAPKRAA